MKIKPLHASIISAVLLVMALISTKANDSVRSEFLELNKRLTSIEQRTKVQVENYNYLKSKIVPAEQTADNKEMIMTKAIAQTGATLQATGKALLAKLLNREKFASISILPEDSKKIEAVLSEYSNLEVIPQTGLKTTKLEVKGTYSNYDDFLLYIKEIQISSVSIINFKVSDDAFHIVLRVYGT